jgi:hypothetical protein
VRPGKCFRLCTEAAFRDLPQTGQGGIKSKPSTDVASLLILLVLLLILFLLLLLLLLLLRASV